MTRLFFLHAFGASARSWDGVVARLKAEAGDRIERTVTPLDSVLGEDLQRFATMYQRSLHRV